ncbi:MAG TPA: SDR family oxidoreductase [Ilumatobacteraceae bacterium]|nr:SDR family oxidoreductase [Ilumatobacteraceae bacterium]
MKDYYATVEHEGVALTIKIRALVTGGGSGIGAAIAVALRRAGADVLTVDVDAATGADLVGDVAVTTDVERTFTAVRDRLGGLDLLVNNVGVAGPTAGVADMDPDEFDRCVQINLGSAFRCTRAAVPLLRERRGSIVNISSTAGIFGYPLRSPYAAAKWGVIGLTKTWAMELGPEGIRVNAICPGSVDGPRMDGVIAREAALRGVDEADLRRRYEGQVSMRSFIDASDVAEAVLWLTSPASRFVNGQILSVDGHTETLATLS